MGGAPGISIILEGGGEDVKTKHPPAAAHRHQLCGDAGSTEDEASATDGQRDVHVRRVYSAARGGGKAVAPERNVSAGAVGAQRVEVRKSSRDHRGSAPYVSFGSA